MADLSKLTRKLHSCQVILWLKHTYCVSSSSTVLTDDSNKIQEESQLIGLTEEEDSCTVRDTRRLLTITGDPELEGLSKSSVYKAYVAMCEREGLDRLFTPPVLGKMVKRAFPSVGTKRKGPRGQVTQFYMGLYPQSQIAEQLQQTMSSVKQEHGHYQQARDDRAFATDHPTIGDWNRASRMSNRKSAGRRFGRKRKLDDLVQPDKPVRTLYQTDQGHLQRQPHSLRIEPTDSAKTSALPRDIPLDAPWAKIYLTTFNSSLAMASQSDKNGLNPRCELQPRTDICSLSTRIGPSTGPQPSAATDDEQLSAPGITGSDEWHAEGAAEKHSNASEAESLFTDFGPMARSLPPDEAWPTDHMERKWSEGIDELLQTLLDDGKDVNVPFEENSSCLPLLEWGQLMIGPPDTTYQVASW